MNRGPMLILALVCGVGAFYYAAKGSSAAEGLDYVHDWKQAQKTARSDKKPILLNFGGPW